MRGRSPYRLFGSFHPVGMAAPLGIRSEAVPDNPGLSCTSKIIPLNGMPVRLKVSYSLDKGILPLDYRRGFASLLKEAIKRSDAHRYRRYYFRHHVLKPFTFSVFFPGLKGVESSSQKRLRVGSEAVLYFSTWDSELGVAIYNSLLSISEYPLFEDRLRRKKLLLLPNQVITQERAVFGTMAPVLINTKGEAGTYLLPGEAGFAEGLEFAVQEVSRAFLEMPEVKVRFRSIFHRRKVVHHYAMCMQGFVGVFELEAPPQVLNLLYYVGLGMRRSQGFGMLKLINTSHPETSSIESGL